MFPIFMMSFVFIIIVFCLFICYLRWCYNGEQEEILPIVS